MFEVLDAGLHALELAHRAQIPIVYGTDLLGGMHEEQLSEFTLRRQVQPPADMLRSATTVAARSTAHGGTGGRRGSGSLCRSARG